MCVWERMTKLNCIEERNWADCTPLLLYCTVIIRGIHDDKEDALKFRNIYSLETTQVHLIAFHIWWDSLHWLTMCLLIYCSWLNLFEADRNGSRDTCSLVYSWLVGIKDTCSLCSLLHNWHVKKWNYYLYYLTMWSL